MSMSGPSDPIQQEPATKGAASDGIDAGTPPRSTEASNEANLPPPQPEPQTAPVSSNFEAAIALSSAGIPIFPVKLYQPTGATKFNKKPLIKGWQAGGTT